MADSRHLHLGARHDKGADRPLFSIVAGLPHASVRGWATTRARLSRLFCSVIGSIGSMKRQAKPPAELVASMRAVEK